MTRFEPLPASDDKYWEHSETVKHELQTSPACRHKFLRVKPQQIECERCNMGLYITKEDKIKKGHLYRGNKLII